MIEITYNALFIFYLGATLAIILGVWIYSHYGSKRRVIFSNDNTLFVCEYCHFAYVEDSLKQLNSCPQCGLFNKSNAYQK